MRLFMAIDLDDDARRAIAVEQKRLAEALGSRLSLKWVRPEHMHLTLAFLGEIEEARIQEVIDATGEDLDAQPFAIAFAGLGVFPSHGAPRVLWVGLTTGVREAIDLERRIAARLSRIGLALEAGAFRPHLTIARWREARQADGRRVAAVDRGTEIARVEVDAVTLYQSRLSSSGPTYSGLARAPLVGGVPL